MVEDAERQTKRERAVRIISDRTGRFPNRVFYTRDELEGRALATLASISRPLAHYPVTMKELCEITTMQRFSVELEADLPEGIDANIQFFDSGTGLILLNSARASKSRLRMSMAHEIGHLVLHRDIIYGAALQNGFYEIPVGDHAHSQGYDWLEWQASYFAASLLMPREALVEWLKKNKDCVSLPFRANTPERLSVIGGVADDFLVSSEAVRIRFDDLRLIIEEDGQAELF